MSNSGIQNQETGLRERKKRATKYAIEQAATQLVLEHGYDETTVEMICEKAGISPRTFFNYVGTKDAAVLGSGIPFGDPSLHDRFVAGLGGTVIEDLVTAINEAFDNSASERALIAARHKIMKRHPELMEREFGRMEEAKELLFSMVFERIKNDDLLSGSNGVKENQVEQAQIIVSLTLGIAHFVAMKWSRSPVEASIGDLFREAFQRAQVIFNERCAGK